MPASLAAMLFPKLPPSGSYFHFVLVWIPLVALYFVVALGFVALFVPTARRSLYARPLSFLGGLVLATAFASSTLCVIGYLLIHGVGEVVSLWIVVELAALFLFALFVLLMLMMVMNAKPEEGLKLQEAGGFYMMIAVMLALSIPGLRAIERHQAVSPFRQSVDSYARVAALDHKTWGQPYIRGKAVAIKKNGKMDGLYFALPAKLRATRPNKVGTLLLVSCHESVWGHYSSGGIGYQTICLVKVIDYRKKVVTGSESFAGNPPPDVVSSAGDQHMGRPKAGKIVAWLKSLPTIGLDGKPPAGSAPSPGQVPTQSQSTSTTSTFTPPPPPTMPTMTMPTTPTVPTVPTAPTVPPMPTAPTVPPMPTTPTVPAGAGQ